MGTSSSTTSSHPATDMASLEFYIQMGGFYRAGECTLKYLRKLPDGRYALETLDEMPDDTDVTDITPVYIPVYIPVKGGPVPVVT